MKPLRSLEEKKQIAKRFVDHFLFKPTDRPPYWETIQFWDFTLNRWEKEGLPEGSTGEDYFDMEALHWIPEIPIIWIPFFPEFEEKVLSEDEDFRVVRNAFGITLKENKQAESMPLWLDFPVQDRKSWESIKHRLDPTNAERYKALEPITADFNARRGIPRGQEVCPFPVCGGYGTCRNLFGEERLAYAFYDDPKLIHEIMETWTGFYCQFAEQLKLRFDFVYIWDDMAYKNGPLISPEMVKEFLAPHYRELIQHLGQLGYTVFMWDSDGDPRKILPLFAEAGVNTFLPCEINSGVEPLELQQEYGKTLSLCGGVDKKVLAASKEDIYEEVMRKVPDLLRHGGYVPAVDHGVPNNVPFENFCYFVEMVRKLGKEISPEL